MNDGDFQTVLREVAAQLETTQAVRRAFREAANKMDDLEAAVPVPDEPPPPVPVSPSTVTDLTVSGLTETSAVLSFTEVDNGAGGPSSYDVRFAVQPLNWGTANPVSVSPLQGASIGARRTFTVQGLSPGTSYQFQIIAFRGTLNVDAVFGALSNVATGATAAVAAPVEDPLPPVVLVVAGWPNQPTAFSQLSDNPMTQLTGDGWNLNPTPHVSIVSVPDSPTAGGQGLAMLFQYPFGFAGGQAPGTLYRSVGQRSQVYAGMWWKPSTPWHGHPSNVNKIAFLMAAGDGGGNTYLAMYGSPGGPYHLRVLPQLAGFTSAWLTPNVGSGLVTLGQWHKIEWLVAGATTLVWLNGTLVIERVIPSVDYVEFQLSPTWGGVGGTKTQADSFFYDHVRLAAG